MKCISLHQPWSQLLVVGIKTYETRSWPCPPSIIGQRIAIHAAKRKPEFAHVGEWVVASHDDRAGMWRRDDPRSLVPLPLGCIVGTATITASLPIVSACVAASSYPADGIYVCTCGKHEGLWRDSEWEVDLSDQLPYGDWTPGRYAWLIEDVVPTTERCPVCLGCSAKPAQWHPCSVCGYAGRCEPIPATGRQGWWNWEVA